MVKVIVGSALGGLLAGAIAFVAAAQMRAPTIPGPDAYALGAGMPAPAIQCASSQEATMTRVLVNGREAAALACVDRVDPRASSPAVATIRQANGPAVSEVPPVAVAQPVSARQGSRTPTARPAVLYQDRDDVVRYEPDQKPKRRSVGKTVLIIGGSAGAGAGVGAMAGGKKGALIGAAIGGGAASIYEAMKR